jgi:hypothetical protein
MDKVQKSISLVLFTCLLTAVCLRTRLHAAFVHQRIFYVITAQSREDISRKDR